MGSMKVPWQLMLMVPDAPLNAGYSAHQDDFHPLHSTRVIPIVHFPGALIDSEFHMFRFIITFQPFIIGAIATLILPD